MIWDYFTFLSQKLPFFTKNWFDNKKIAKRFKLKFFLGAHHFTPWTWFIPEDEIWLSDEMTLREVRATIVHELTEVELMKKGMPYRKAHRLAEIEEKKYLEGR